MATGLVHLSIGWLNPEFQIIINYRVGRRMVARYHGNRDRCEGSYQCGEHRSEGFRVISYLT